MSKFNVGDKVRRIGMDSMGAKYGFIYVVSYVDDTHIGLRDLASKGTRTPFTAHNFELVATDDVLDDREVFNAIVDGKPLQYSYNNGITWSDLKYPEKLTLLDVQRGTYRVRPTDVKLECTVPYPECSVGRVYSNKVRKYSVDFGTGSVRDYGEADLPLGGVFWSSREQAEQFRDTVLASLQGKYHLNRQ